MSNKRSTAAVVVAVLAFACMSAAPARAEPHLNANQQSAGCRVLYGQIFCTGPGPGMCWKKGHNPYLGQPAEGISVGNADLERSLGVPVGPDEDHPERCG